MGRFLNKIFVFTALLGIINLGFYFLTNTIYYLPYQQDINSDYRSFLIADSHGRALGVSTEEYGIFNLSSGGDSYIDMGRKINFLIKNNLADTIFLTVDDHNLTTYREKLNNNDRSIIYLDNADYPSISNRILNKYVKRYIVLLNPKARSVLVSYLSEKIFKSKKVPKADKWQEKTYEKRLKIAQTRVRYQFPTSPSSKLLKRTLEDIIYNCKENKVVLIGIKFPLTKVYSDLIEGKSSGADYALLEKGCQVFDFKNIYVDKPEYFKNEDHLNELGRVHFSKYLMSEIINKNKVTIVNTQ